MSALDRLKNVSREQHEMLEDILANDTVFVKHSETAKEAAKIKQSTKAQIMKRPEVFGISEKIKSLREEKKTLENALSDYLKEYQRLSGQNTIEDEKGEVCEIVFTAKLSKKSRYNP